MLSVLVTFGVSLIYVTKMEEVCNKTYKYKQLAKVIRLIFKNIFYDCLGRKNTCYANLHVRTRSLCHIIYLRGGQLKREMGDEVMEGGREGVMEGGRGRGWRWEREKVWEIKAKEERGGRWERDPCPPLIFVM